MQTVITQPHLSVNRIRLSVTESDTPALWIIPGNQALSYSASEVRYGIICANNPINFVDPLGLRVVLSGSAQEQQMLQALLTKFVRGAFSVGEGGALSRDPCDQDQGYEGEFDKLLSSPADYVIKFSADAWDYGGGEFRPGAFGEGGTILLAPDIGYHTTYLGWRGGSLVGDVWTPEAMLAHELGHAIAHVNEVKYSDMLLPAGHRLKAKVEKRVWSYTETPYERLNQAFPAQGGGY